MPGPPALPARPATRRFGCGSLLLVALALLLLSVGLFIFGVFRTPMPFYWIAAIAQKFAPGVKISGVGGNIGTGPSIESIEWGSGESKSELRGLRIKYNGYSDARANRRVIFYDVGVKKAHLDFTDWTKESSTFHTTNSSTHSNSVGPANSSTLPAPLDLFAIDRFSLEDILLTDRKTHFSLAIPKIEWTGFKVRQSGVELGEIVIESDLLSVHTSAGRTLPLEGQQVAFQKTVTGTAKPPLHEGLKQPLHFVADLNMDSEGSPLPFHLDLADGKVELSILAGGAGSLHVRNLDLASFVDPAVLSGKAAPELPKDLVLDAVAVAGPGQEPVTRLVRGSFVMGVARFEIQPREMTGSLSELHGTVRAVCRRDGQEIVWTLPLGGAGYHPQFSSVPPLAPAELLARVFAGQTYTALAGAAREEIDARVPIYFSQVLKSADAATP